MFIPNRIQRQGIEEKFIGAREHGTNGEELRISLVKFGPAGDERLELRNWTRSLLTNEQTPSRHGINIPTSLIPFVLEVLSKINPAESNSTENLRNKIQ